MKPEDLAKLREQAGIVNEVFFYDADKEKGKTPSTPKDVAIIMTGIISKKIGLNAQNIRDKGQAAKATMAAKELKIAVNAELDKMIKEQLG